LSLLRSEARRFDLFLLIGLPVVIGRDRDAVLVEQGQNRIRQRRANAGPSQARPDGAQDHSRAHASLSDKAADKHVFTLSDACARGEVTQA
jgi:hypothetical protein